MTRDEELEKAARSCLVSYATEDEVYAFKAGANWERERAKVLVEAVERHQQIWDATTGGCPILQKALKHYQGEGNG